VSRYQKGKTNLDFTEARDSEWQWHQLGCMQVCTLLQTDNHANNPPLISDNIFDTFCISANWCMSLIVRGGLCSGCVRGGMLLGGGTWPVEKGVVALR